MAGCSSAGGKPTPTGHRAISAPSCADTCWRSFPSSPTCASTTRGAGRLAITRSRLPHFGRIEKCGFFAQGFSGHGVALTQLAGKLLAEAVAGTAERFDVFARLPHRRFPGGAWVRQPLLAAGMLYYSLRDRL